MENEKWDINEWQGRSKEKVEKNYRVFGYMVILTIFVLTVFLIFFLGKSILNL